MDAEVLRAVIGILASFALAFAGMRGLWFAGFAMVAIGIALTFPALDALDYAEVLHEFNCDEACGNRGGWQFTKDAWQWDALWIAALAGTGTLGLSVALAVVAGGAGALARFRALASRLHLLAAVAMALAVASYGAFTIIVAPLGERYGI